MVKLSLLIAITINFCLFSQSNEIHLKQETNEIDFRTIQIEIEWFIEKVKPMSYKQGKHNVYAVKIFEGDNNGEFCVTMGYFDNSQNIKYVEGFKYYIILKNDLIIIDYSNEFKEKYSFKNADSIKILDNKKVIYDKIDEDIVALGIWEGYFCCYEKGKIKKVFYEDSDEIPNNYTIFKKKIHHGTAVEVDSSKLIDYLKKK